MFKGLNFKQTNQYEFIDLSFDALIEFINFVVDSFHLPFILIAFIKI